MAAVINLIVMLFVTGTDTGVGKTYFCSQLIRWLRSSEINAVGFKPICCGDRTDASILTKASGGVISEDECNPIWMRFPASPYTASLIEERPIDLTSIHDQFRLLREQFSTVIVEGVGGWCVPIRRDYSTADLACEFGTSVLVVASNRLGVLNHTLLTVRAIQAAGLPVVGVVLNAGQAAADGEDDPVVPTNRSVLEDVLISLKVPVLGEMKTGDAHLHEDICAKLLARFAGKNSLPNCSI